MLANIKSYTRTVAYQKWTKVASLSSREKHINVHLVLTVKPVRPKRPFAFSNSTYSSLRMNAPSFTHCFAGYRRVEQCSPISFPWSTRLRFQGHQSTQELAHSRSFRRIRVPLGRSHRGMRWPVYLVGLVRHK